MKSKKFSRKRAPGSLPVISDKKSPPEIIEVRIETLIFGGSGLARTDKGVVFVDFALVGELLRVEITEQKKDYRRGRILEILEASSLRLAAPCPVFGKCGGCDWQHLPYSEQLSTKQRLVDELCSRKKLEIGSFLPIKASPLEWNYRNRIQVHIDERGPYYHSKRSHKPVHISNCPIAEEAINNELTKIKPVKGGEPKRVQVSSKGISETSDELFGHEFSQVNSLQNNNLIATVLEWARPLQIERFFDLYAGSGNFSFPLLEERPKLLGLGVELNSSSVSWAHDELQKRKIKTQSLQFLCGSVDTTLPRLSIPPESLIILDPPRDGISETVAQQLCKIQCQSIFYISCNPATLVRDLERITKQSKWKIHRMQLFDMFPQTAHIEVLTELRIDTRT
ncbi:MAG: hypothetical protein ABS42_00225 [Bdellovibrio sp. SCN 50-8]|nr:MAG: hypothetical protein ABS42_00225 [Bdellovibrio sp. SCN 50-8]